MPMCSPHEWVQCLMNKAIDFREHDFFLHQHELQCTHNNNLLSELAASNLQMVTAIGSGIQS